MSHISDLESTRRAQILEAALKTISNAGCSNTTMDDIARAANLSKGGLTHYFRSKKTLFKAAFKEFFQRIFLRGEITMAQFEDPLDKLLSFSWLYDRENLDADIGYPVLFDFMAIAVHDREYRILFHNWVENWINLLKSALETGQASGRFANLDPEATARAISAIYQGIATRWYLDPESHPTEWAIDMAKKAITGLLNEYGQTPD